MTFAILDGVVARPRGVYTSDLTRVPWTPVANKPEVQQKAVHTDGERGMFIGLVAFDENASTGLHQHTGPASSFFLGGVLADYGGTQLGGDFTVNPTGATHDAICLSRCAFVSKLEAPLMYAPDVVVTELHNNPLHGEFSNPLPEDVPDIVLTPAQQRMAPTVLGGVSRADLYDYAGEAADSRVCKLQLLPGTVLPPHRTTAWVHWYLIGGELVVNGTRLAGGSFLILEPGTETVARSDFGCLAVCWAEGPVAWEADRKVDLYGF
jgi:quercetin dioxygenase-like cupin family protein